MSRAKSCVFGLLLVLSILLAPGIGAERCRDCAADTCVMVGGYGFRSCWEVPIYQWRCVLRLNNICIEYEGVEIGWTCRTSLGGCIGAH
jgi:hypothetical protein